MPAAENICSTPTWVAFGLPGWDCELNQLQRGPGPGAGQQEGRGEEASAAREVSSQPRRFRDARLHAFPEDRRSAAGDWHARGAVAGATLSPGLVVLRVSAGQGDILAGWLRAFGRLNRIGCWELQPGEVRESVRGGDCSQEERGSLEAEM